MDPRIENLEEKKFIGMNETMSLADNKTFILFRKFMPRRKEIQHPVSNDIYDLQIYPDNYHSNFSPTNPFTKWAMVEVSSFANIPEGMEAFTLVSGTYAVFTAAGLSKDKSIFQYIFTQWLPQSDYILDSRPHFDIMGEEYQQKGPDAEQEIWIPVKRKT